MKRCAALVIMFFRMTIPAVSQGICYPPHFGGIVPGITVDKEVVAMYGDGFFSDSLGHLGGRYYTDSTRSITMIVEIGVDRIIESIWLKEGIDFPANAPKELRSFIAHSLDLRDDGRLLSGLGATREEVRKEFGNPTTIHKNGNIWEFQTDYHGTECYIDASVNFWFRGDRVTTVIFSNGE